LVWRNTVDRSLNQGFGDKIRGAISTYQVCKGNNFRLILDGTEDICSKFLKNIITDSYSLVKDQPLTSRIDHNTSMADFSDNIIKALATSDHMILYATNCPRTDDCHTFKPDILSEDDKQFARWVCEPFDYIEREIQQAIRNLPPQYGIQHFRFDDSIFTNDIDDANPTFAKFFSILKDKYKPTDVLISNSVSFKKYAKEKLNISTLDCNGELCKVQHTGESIDYNAVKASMMEFFIISRSKYIQTATSYGWVSNFVKWPALIYDIPLTSN
jgi:hypothetical protein